MSGKKVFVLNLKTGKQREYSTYLTAEMDIGWYRGAIGELFRLGKDTWKTFQFSASPFDAPFEENETFQKSSIQKRGLSIEEFRDKFDVTTIIRKACQNLKRNELLTQSEFVDGLKLPNNTGYKEKLMSSEFEHYRGMVTSSDIRWGHPHDIKMLKEERLLR